MGLRDGKEYWVYVVEDPEEEEKDRERMKEVVKKLSEEIAMASKGEVNEFGDLCREAGVTESCSCIEGNPCVDQYLCRDWHRRYQISKENGWKG